MSLNTTPRTWVTGEFVTAAMMNTEIRDALAGVQSGWTAYTPTSAQITFGNAAVDARYQRLGKTIAGRVRLVLGNTSVVAAGSLIFALPASLSSNYDQVSIGSAYMLDASAGSASRRIASVVVTGSGVFLVDNDTGGTVTNTVPWTWANGDVLTFGFLYEAA